MVQGLGDVVEGKSGRTMRVRKVVKPCPSCKADLADFVKVASVNRSDSISKLGLMSHGHANLQTNMRNTSEKGHCREPRCVCSFSLDQAHIRLKPLALAK